jgi:plasmid stability protein
MIKTTFYLPAELHGSLKEAARRSQKSQANIVREVLAAHFRNQERPWPRSIGAGENPNLDARDTEACLEAHWGRR